MNELFKDYNLVVQDFETFFDDNFEDLLSKLTKYGLSDDFELKNPDTKKIIHNFLITKSLELFKNQEHNHIFIIKPEIFNNKNKVYEVFNSKKIRREIFKYVTFIKKWFKYNFAILNKSHADYVDNNLIKSEVIEHVNLFLFHSSKNIFNSKQLSKELYKTYENSNF